MLVDSRPSLQRKRQFAVEVGLCSGCRACDAETGRADQGRTHQYRELLAANPFESVLRAHLPFS
jgi:hypothetical protein